MTMNITPVTGNNTEIAQALLAEILGNTTGLSKIQATITGSPESFGKFTGDPFGLNGGIVLSTGYAAQVVGPNNFDNLTGEMNGDPEGNGGIFDETVLTITFDAAIATKAYFSYVFGSDEFIEFGGTEFNDKFELLINGVNAAKLSNGEEISVNTLVPNQDDPSTWSPEFIDNTAGKTSQDTELDGYTKFLNFEANIVPGVNTITIRVKDVGDNQYDSAVFIKKGSLGTIKPVVPTPPPAPTDLDLLTDTATTKSPSTTDNRTYEATPDFSGKGFKVGNKIKLFSNFEGLIGETTVQADNSWTLTNANVGGSDLLVGSHEIYAIEYDAESGLASPFSAPLSIFIDSIALDTDTIAPDAPANLDLTTDDINSFGDKTNTDNDTNNRTPIISGTAEIDSIVTLYSHKDGIIGSTRVGRDGKWSITSNLLQSGEHIVTAEARDWAGNVSGQSVGLDITVRNVPSAPDMSSASDTGISKTDNITYNTTPTFTGVAEANSQVELFLNDVSAGTVNTDANGVWSFTPTALAEGTYQLKARAVNKQYGTYDDFSNALSFTIDTTEPGDLGAPSVPDLTNATDNGLSSIDNITSVKSPSFTGTAEPNSYVTISSSLNGVLGTVKTDATGKWVLNVSKRKKLMAGNHTITAVAKDVAGNESVVSAPLSMTSLPDVSMPDLKASSDSGISDTDNYTNDITPTFTGTAELGSTVTLFYINGETRVDIGSAVANTDDGEGGGLWEITASDLPEGTYDIKAEAAKNGFQSLTSASLQVTIDTDMALATPAPSIPDLSTVSDSGTDTADNITTNSQPTFTGTGVAGNTIELYDGATKIGSTTVAIGGTWSITPATLALGLHDISAKQIDKAGNVSANSAILDSPNKVTIVEIPLANTLDLITIDDTGSSSTDNVTKTNTPTITGKAPVGSTVEIYDGATKLGTATADASGNWSYTASALADGSHPITAKAIDIYGNEGPVSAALSLTIDTAAPGKPITPDMTAATDSGSSNVDNLTNNAKPIFTGTTEANSKVEVFVDGISQGFATVSNGTWSYTPAATLTEGDHAIKVQITDLAGNVSPVSDELSFTIDLTPPATPATEPDMTDASDTGTSNTDNTTKTNQPIFTGTVAGDAVKAEIFIDGTSQGTVNVTGGSWSYTPTTAILDGNHYIEVKAIDNVDNRSALSPKLDFTIDTAITKPIVSTISDDSGIPADGITNDTTLVFNGTAEANSSVDVFLDGIKIGTTTADGTGKWSLDHGALPLIDKSYAVTAQATDKAGNISVPSNSFNITVDTVNPSAPVVTGISQDTGSFNTDGLTNDNKLIINGIAEANSTVDVFKDGTKIGTVTANATGNWLLDYQSTTLSDGSYNFTAKATDKAANVSNESAPFTVKIDTVAPTKPIVASITDDTGIFNSDGITNDNKLFINGTAEANSSVEIYQGVTKIGTTTADASGNWTLNYQGTTLVDGSYVLTAKSIDPVGNSASSDPFSLTIDTTNAAPAVTAISVDSGLVGDHLTSDQTLIISGTAEANSSVDVFRDGVKIGTVLADSTNKWTIDDTATTLTDGNTYVFTAQSTDKAGNLSVLSPSYSVTIDATSPNIPVVSSITNDTGAFGNDGITSDNTLKINGTAEANSTVDVFQGAAKIGSTTADTNGNWTLDYTGTVLADGAYNFTVKAIDKAGNSSNESASFAVQIDTKNPNKPIIVSINDDTNISTDGVTSDNTLKINGTAEANSTIDVFQEATKIGSTTADANGNWTLNYTGTVLAGGNYVLTAKAIDKAGNVSVAADPFNLTVDTTAPSATVISGMVTSDDTGIGGDGITSNLEPQFQGTAESGSTIQLIDGNGTVIGTGVADAAGSWKIKTTPQKRQGTQKLKAVAIDKAGNSSLASPEVSFEIDDEAPLKSAAPDLTDAADTGALNNDNITGNDEPEFTGMAESGSKVELFSDRDGLIGTATADAAGKWAIKSSKMRQGSHKIVSRAIDIAGNTSALSDALDMQILTVDLSVDQVSIAESGGKAIVTAKLRDGVTTDKDVVVRLKAGGKASSSDYSLPETITIQAGENSGFVELVGVDDFFAEDPETISLEIGSVENAVENGVQQATIAITSEDTAGVVVSQTNLLTSEAGTSASFTVKLSSRPTDVVTIALTNADLTEGSIDKPTLTFTTDNWNVAQTVTVTGLNDDLADSSITYTIATDASSNDTTYDHISVPDITVTNADDDTAGITVTPVSLQTSEAGGEANFGVILNTQPTADVTVALTVENTEGKLNTTTLTFNSTNWNVVQKVTVTGLDDNLDDDNITYTIVTSATSSDKNYNNIDVNDVVVENIDNDAAGVTITPLSTIITEGGATGSYSVVLNSQPTSDVTVKINNGSQIGTDLTTLTFTSQNWNQPQTVNVTAVNDDVAEGTHTDTVTHTIESADVKYNSITATAVTANITDNDSAGVVIMPSSGSTSLTEGGASDSYTVVLNSRPTADVTVTIAGDIQSNTDQKILTFTPDTWNVAQTVTVTAADDKIAEGTHTSTISHTATSSDKNYNDIVIAAVNANVTDNDTAGITFSSLNLNTTEAGEQAILTVVLNSEPTAEVTLTLTNGNTSEGSLSITTFTFDSGNWDEPRTLTVTGEDDLVDDGDISYTIATSITSSDTIYGALKPVDVTVTNADDDTAGVMITAVDGLFTTEAGSEASFMVVLTSKPTADVTVNLVSSNPKEGSVPASIVFSPDNWNTAQTVNVTGVEDAIADGDQSYKVLTSISSSDNKYAAIDPADVSLTNTDNDSPGVTITQSNGNTQVVEGGETDAYTIVLNSQPTSSVTVTLATNSQLVTSSNTITFTPEDWNKAQTVTVTATNDDISEGSHSSTIFHTVSSDDPIYNGLSVLPIGVNIVDNDTAGIVLTPVENETSEDGTTGSFKVALNSEPTADVVLKFTSNRPTEGKPQQDTLTFTAANWKTTQVITVKGIDDFEVDGNKPYSITTTATSSDTHYNALSVGVVKFTNLDNDKAGVILKPIEGLMTTEAGGTANFSVVLTSKPSANVIINLASSNPAEGRVPQAITFNANNWNQPQTVIVSGVDDKLVDGDTKYTIVTSITSADANYAAIDPADVSLTNQDNEFNSAPIGVNVSSELAPNQSTNLTGVVATDVDGNIVIYTIATLPEEKQGVLFLGDPNSGGTRISAGQVLRPDQTSQLFFKASGSFRGAQFTYTSTDNLGKTGNPATVTLDVNKTFDGDEGDANVGCSNRKGIIRKGKTQKDNWRGSQGRDRLMGGGGNDQIHGGASADVIRGGTGKDKLYGDDCNDIINGDVGNDRMYGGRGFDRLSGGAGNDRLFGNQHSDKMSGGRGNDRMKGGSGSDRLKGGSGNDRLFGGNGNDQMNGGFDNDGLRGGSGNDQMQGSTGNDRLEGGSGNDRLEGGRGNDLLDGGSGNDRLKGGQSRDILKGRQGNDQMDGGNGDDLLKGGNGRDVLKGGAGNDRLAGASQSDRISGGAGNDFIVGGASDDLLTGGTGRDRFVYTKFGETLGDRITDFEVGKDVLDLRRLLGKLNVNRRNFSQSVKLDQIGSNTQVKVDLNGKAAGGFQTLVTLDDVNASSVRPNSFLL